MKKLFIRGVMLLCVLLIVACGGDGNSTPDPTPTDPAVSTGVFLDSPVAGISYRTETKSGETNAEGEYEYVAGETVVFFIGGLEFPPVAASGVVTPVDIAAGNNTIQTNILQLLQTLDSDGNPDNGITIYPEAAAAFAGAAMDLYSDTFDDDVTSVLDTIGAGLKLVTAEIANAHFEKSQKSQILGSWVYSEGDGKRNVLTFIDDTRYIIIHEHADEPDEPGHQTAGSVEYGTYTWDTTNGDFEATLIDESDGWGGLYDEGSTVTSAGVQNNTLTLSISDDGGVDVVFTRIPNPVDALTGSYIYTEDEETDSINVLTFLSDSEYVIAHTQNDGAQALSGEFGTYTYDGFNFEVQGASVDSDEEGGLYNGDAPEDQMNESMFLTASGSLVFSCDSDDEDPAYFKRISSILSPSYTQSDLTGTWYSTGVVTPNQQGTIDANSFTDAGTMTVEPNGDYEWITKDAHSVTDTETGTLAFLDSEKGTLTDSQTGEILGWFMNAGKDVMTLVFNDSGDNEQGTITFVKAAVAYASSDLTGIWNSVGVGTPNQGGDVTNYWADAGTMEVAEDGSYVWETDSEEGNLTLTEDGLVSSDHPSSDENLGWYMNARKDVMTLVFDDTGDKEQGTMTFVKAATACTLTDLAGAWHSVGTITPAENATPEQQTANHWAEAGTVIIDAYGKYIWTTNDDEDSGTLTLSTNGEITEAEASDVLGWYLNAGKDVMILVFNNTDVNEQGIITFVKQK